MNGWFSLLATKTDQSGSVLQYNTGSLPESPFPMADSEGLVMVHTGKGANPGMAFIHLFVIHQHSRSLCSCVCWDMY